MREEFVVPAHRLVPLPPQVSDEHGALVEPVAVGVHAARLATSLIGRDVLVLGAGTIGLITAQVVRAYGARRVAVTDIVPDRLALAARLDLLGIDAGPLGLDDRVAKCFAERRPDIAFECVGAEATLRQAIELVRKGGEIIVIGVFGNNATVPAGLIQDRELHIRGSLMYTRGDFEEAARLIADQHIQVDLLVSHRVPLEDVEHAFRLAATRARALKVIVIP